MVSVETYHDNYLHIGHAWFTATFVEHLPMYVVRGIWYIVHVIMISTYIYKQIPLEYTNLEYSVGISHMACWLLQLLLKWNKLSLSR